MTPALVGWPLPHPKTAIAIPRSSNSKAAPNTIRRNLDNMLSVLEWTEKTSNKSANGN
jgi:hypothetical protein